MPLKVDGKLQQFLRGTVPVVHLECELALPALEPVKVLRLGNLALGEDVDDASHGSGGAP